MNALEYVTQKARETGYTTYDEVQDKWNYDFTIQLFSFLVECNYIENCKVLKEEIVANDDHYVWYDVVVQIDDVYIGYGYGQPKDNSPLEFDLDSIGYLQPKVVTVIEYLPI